jgi:hypothetical protein
LGSRVEGRVRQQVRLSTGATQSCKKDKAVRISIVTFWSHFET